MTDQLGVDRLTDEQLLENIHTATNEEAFARAKFYSVAYLVRHGGDADHLRTLSARDLYDLIAEASTITARPYEARQCPACNEWIYTAGGPFAEGDRTKTLADSNHWEREHATPSDHTVSASGAEVFGFPYFKFNEVPVTAKREGTA